jgi:dTDP-glucose pyrophosphorylase
VLKIIIPAAGNGQRFADAGYKEPKPLIKVDRHPMIRLVAKNLQPANVSSETIVIHRLDKKWELPLGLTSLKLSKPTGGAVQTLLAVRGQIGVDEPIIIANCDQLALFKVEDLITVGDVGDGAIVTFPSNKPHHSYVKLSNAATVKEIVEKEVVSNAAVTGIYYFKRAGQFFKACQQVIEEDLKVKGEYYVSSAIQKMIDSGASLYTLDCPSAMLGTPEELQLFELAIKVARNVV